MAGYRNIFSYTEYEIGRRGKLLDTSGACSHGFLTDRGQNHFTLAGGFPKLLRRETVS